MSRKKVYSKGEMRLAHQARSSHRLPRPHQAIITKGDTAWRLQRYGNKGTLHLGCSGLEVQDDDPTTLEGRREVADGQWHHVAGVYDGTRMSLYIDGEVDVLAGADGILSTNDRPVWIGANGEVPGCEWSGFIDDVRIYNYALDAIEILTQSLPRRSSPRM